MKTHLTIYALLIILFIGYNFFFKVADTRINTAINIVLGSIIFGYIAFMAFILLRKMSKKK